MVELGFHSVGLGEVCSTN